MIFIEKNLWACKLTFYITKFNTYKTLEITLEYRIQCMSAKFYRTIMKMILSSPYIMNTFYDKEDSYFWNNYDDLLLVVYSFQKIPSPFNVRTNHDKHIRVMNKEKLEASKEKEYVNSATTGDSAQL